MRKKKTLPKLKQEAMALLQRIVRAKAAVQHGEYIPCCCCGETGHWLYDMDGGHFFSRSQIPLLEENIHPQLKGCNLRMSKGDTRKYEGYRRFMVDTYGEEFIEELLIMSKKPIKYTRVELEDLVQELKSQKKELEAQL